LGNVDQIEHIIGTYRCFDTAQNMHSIVAKAKPRSLFQVIENTLIIFHPN